MDGESRETTSSEKYKQAPTAFPLYLCLLKRHFYRNALVTYPDRIELKTTN